MAPTGSHPQRHREQPMSGPRRSVLMGALALLAASSLGFIAGLGRAAIERGFDPLTWLLLALALIVGTASALAFYRMLRTSRAEPEAENIRRSRNWVWASVALGAVLGLVLTAANLEGDPTDLFSKASLPPALAGAALTLWIVVLPFVIWQWYLNVDEHERQSYNFGGLAALNFYVCATPGWWLGWRGGFLPQPDHMIVFLVTMVIWTAGWFWRRYR